jgi:hypothetical protein
MQPITRTVSSVTTSTPAVMNYLANPFSVGFAVVLSAGANLTYSVQHTFDDVNDPTVTPTWFDHEIVVGQTTNQDGNYAFNVRAIRLNVTAHVGGSATLTLIQGGR